MGKTNATARRRLNATIRQAGLSIGIHLCRFCKADPPEHRRCAEALDDPLVCYCDCNELDNRYGFSAGPDEIVVPVKLALRHEQQEWFELDGDDADEATPSLGGPYTHTLRASSDLPTYTVERLD